MAALLIGLGGASGAIMRHFVAVVCRHWWGEQFPWGTLFINLTGALLIGWLTAHVAVTSLWRLPLIVGVLGGYTTFSTWMLEVARLRRARRWGTLVGYAVVAGAGGPLLALLGLQLGGGI